MASKKRDKKVVAYLEPAVKDENAKGVFRYYIILERPKIKELKLKKYDPISRTHKLFVASKAS